MSYQENKVMNLKDGRLLLKTLNERKADVITDTASGSIASFPDGANGMPVKSLVVNVDPVQDLHGQDSPWPAGGGKNKIGTETDVGVNISNTGDVQQNTTESSSTEYYPVSPSTEYTLSVNESCTAVRICEYDSSKSFIRRTAKTNSTKVTVTTDATTAFIKWTVNKDGTTAPTETVINGLQIQLETGSDRTTYSPYSNICPITGWTGANVTRAGKNLLDIDESKMVSSGWNRSFPIKIGAGTFTISLQTSFGVSSQFGAKVRLTAGNSLVKEIVDQYSFGGNNDINPRTFSLTTEEARSIDTIMLMPNASGMTFADIAKAKLMIELGSTATSYEPYSGTTYPITWQTEAGTVYGGNINLITGVLTVDKVLWKKNSSTMNNSSQYPGWVNSGIKAFGVESGTYTNQQMSIGKTYRTNTNGSNDILYFTYNDYKKTQEEWIALAVDVQIIVNLATPVTYQLTNQQVIETLKGVNNVWTDTGNVSVEYPADTKLYISKQLSSSQRLMELIITANHEDSMKATKAYSTGNLLIVENTLYKATTSIANGATLTVGTNVTATTVANELALLA